MLGISIEKTGEGFEPMLQPFTVVEAIRPNNQAAALETFPQPPRRLGFYSESGHFGDGVRVDTNREYAGTKHPIKRMDLAFRRYIAPDAPNNSVLKCSQILDCLKSQEIVGAQ